jgi:hypothetical protein
MAISERAIVLDGPLARKPETPGSFRSLEEKFTFQYPIRRYRFLTLLFAPVCKDLYDQHP